MRQSGCSKAWGKGATRIDSDACIWHCCCLYTARLNRGHRSQHSHPVQPFLCCFHPNRQISRLSFESRLCRIHSLYDCCPKTILSSHCLLCLFFCLFPLCYRRLLSVVDIVPAPASFSCTRRVVTLAVFQLPFCCPAPTTKDDCCCCCRCCCTPLHLGLEWPHEGNSQRERREYCRLHTEHTTEWRAFYHAPLTSIHSCTTLLLLRPSQSGAFVGEPLASPLDSLASRPCTTLEKTKAPVEPTPTLLQPDGRTRLSGVIIH